MSSYKLKAPNPDHVGFIGSESDPLRRTWIVFGVGYTDSPEVVEYARRIGYTVTGGPKPTDDYASAVANLEAFPKKMRRYGTPDGADPDSAFRFTGLDGHTLIDVRDIIAGRPTPTNPTN